MANTAYGYVYCYLCEIPSICKIGFSENLELRKRQHEKDPYWGITPVRDKDGHLMIFCFKIAHYKNVETLFKHILPRPIANAEFYQVEPKRVYELLCRLGGDPQSDNNTGISWVKAEPGSGDDPNFRDLRPRYLAYAKSLVAQGRSSELFELGKSFKHQSEYDALDDQAKGRHEKIGDDIYIQANKSGNEAIRLIGKLQRLLAERK
ncbi:MAG: GIY-YIG nuclease family protein [Propionibacteriaceae bacterium]|nr:GIY-YIG nuclease family protein [Propionibacteriaceae bacterium]